MTPLKGQNVYSRDGTVWLGRVVRVVWPNAHTVARLVEVEELVWASDPYQTVYEWSRQLGGWLAV